LLAQSLRSLVRDFVSDVPRCAKRHQMLDDITGLSAFCSKPIRCDTELGLTD
jgi:hypothetical protein